MIIETVMTTINKNKTPHFAAAGVELFSDKSDRVEFYLYKDSITAENLLKTKKGVINITDSALHLVKSALIEPDFQVKKTPDKDGFYLSRACSYLQFNVNSTAEKKEKYSIEAEIVSRVILREYRGFNRASNLLVEAAVRASRIGISTSRKEVKEFLQKNKRIIIKTAGSREIECYHFLKDYLN